MTNPVLSNDIEDIILIKACEKNPVAFLNSRLVSSDWKTRIDRILENRWEELRKNPPEGVLDILSKMDEIEEQSSQKYLKIEEQSSQKYPKIEQQSSQKHPIIKFKELARVFSDQGIKVESLPLTVDEFQGLQNETNRIYNSALETIWKSTLRDSIIRIINYQVTNAPTPGSSAEEIRNFLNAPSTLPYLTQIKELRLSRVSLRVVPPELNLLSNLEILVLEDCQLSTVLDITKLSNLQVLHLTNNNLSAVPELPFPYLTELYLNRNNLCTVPNFDLPNLQELSLSENKLNIVLDFTTKLPNLQRLTLESNNLSTIPNMSAPRLKSFYFSNNPVMFIDNQILLRFSNVEIKLFNSQLAYPCQSSLANLYQALMKKLQEQINHFFDALDKEDKNLIFEMVWEKAGKPTTTDAIQWGKHHAFEDEQLFALAVQKMIIEKLERLPPAQQNQVYKKISHLSGRSPLLAKDHAREHFPRLADALAGF